MRKVKVVLLKDIINLGKKGDIVDVSFGFYMNYLEKNNLAKRVSEVEKKNYQLRQKIKENKESKEEERAKILKEKNWKGTFYNKKKGWR